MSTDADVAHAGAGLFGDGSHAAHDGVCKLAGHAPAGRAVVPRPDAGGCQRGGAVVPRPDAGRRGAACPATAVRPAE
eukprot:363662-Chlamydomonas_euryale.AAC.2